MQYTQLHYKTDTLIKVKLQLSTMECFIYQERLLHIYTHYIHLFHNLKYFNFNLTKLLITVSHFPCLFIA